MCYGGLDLGDKVQIVPFPQTNVKALDNYFPSFNSSFEK